LLGLLHSQTGMDSTKGAYVQSKHMQGTQARGRLAQATKSKG